MNINSHILKLLGKSELPKQIQEGRNYHVSCEGSVNKVELHDNEDGTWNKIYTFKPIKIDLLNETGQTIKLKDPRKNSQKIRNYLFKIYSQEGYVEDFDKLYDAFTQEVMLMTPQLIREAVKRVNQ